METTEFYSKEELSKLWDRHILISWYKYSSGRCGNMINSFLGKNKGKVNLDDFYALNRVPGPHVLKVDFRLWMNRTMYPIWEKLLETKEDDILGRSDILKRMSKWKKCCKLFRYTTSADRDRTNLRRHIKQNTESRNIGISKVNELYESHKLSNQWDVCK